MRKLAVRRRVRPVTDALYNWCADILRRPWFLRKPNYCGPIKRGMRFVLPPGGRQNTIEILRIGNGCMTIDPFIYWNKLGWPNEYETCSYESELRRMIGADGKPERS